MGLIWWKSAGLNIHFVYWRMRWVEFTSSPPVSLSMAKEVNKASCLILQFWSVPCHLPMPKCDSSFFRGMNVFKSLIFIFWTIEWYLKVDVCHRSPFTVALGERWTDLWVRKSQFQLGLIFFPMQFENSLGSCVLFEQNILNRRHHFKETQYKSTF